jgi:diphosphomevalonate decarboxylase
MQTSVETSELLRQRMQTVPERVEKMKQAILKKDFHTFAEITMKVQCSCSCIYVT